MSGGSGSVSVVVPCFDSGDVVIESVESALAQTYVPLDVIVVDDGSTDLRTLDALVRVAQKPRVRLIRQENSGLSAARNAAIAASNAEYVLPLDADDLIDPRYVEEAVLALSGQPDARLVYSRAELFGTRTGPWELPDFSWERILVHNLIFCSCLYRRADWVRVGGYDPFFKRGREDHDFVLKLLALGGYPVRLDGVYFHYRQSGRSMNDSFAKDRDLLVETSARLLRNNHRLYVEHAEDLFRFIFSQQDQINDLRHRYRWLENLRTRFPRVVKMIRAPFAFWGRRRSTGRTGSAE
ncbi:glycosyltransferase family A protein [Humibacter ginsenosidimutans]|uniref:Glycosyltransferase family 2 protein n=1 Tax=Humibacter ginsenosidimutans TaxID=2599293 RepID=A0A5B8M4Y5_9MICO|nr:glycosyltransferase family A protein [Humibacter ginsenosidimutans]QDZ14984.1 glycosyltransferase family 2 protein [Humibacter ginsenosidimutans]